jgi:hypothetical protein
MRGTAELIPRLRLPGHVLEHVALVGNHRISHTGLAQLLPGGVESLNDDLRQLYGGCGLDLRDRWNVVVVGSVPQTSQRVQVAPGLFHSGLTTVAEAIYEVLMGSVCPRNGKIQVGKHEPSDVECRVVGSADSGPPIRFGGVEGQPGSQQHEVTPIHRQPSTK